ncbi:hypothetical protein [Clostridium oceanicum]|uniref:Membrane protein n=1 Tax=Clostridium oceanicum TaxID=1543 RepID=A0ABP3UY13_9CLOT
MMNIIKTAIITIMISIISGLLLDYWRNLGPRILCDIGKPKVKEKDNKKVYSYIIHVSNQSKKIIHDLTLNIHSLENNLKFENAKITKGLKFESLIKNNTLDICIPFLSKGDKFSVTVYVEDCNKPIITMRSPENFKQIHSIDGKNNFLSSFLLFNKSKDKNNIISREDRKKNNTASDSNNDLTMIMDKVSESDKLVNNKNRKIIPRKNKLNKNKKIIIAITSILLVVIMGALIKFYFNGASNDKQAPSTKTSVPKKSNDSKKESDKENKNIDSNGKLDKGNENKDSTSSTEKPNKNSNSKSSTRTKNENTNTNFKDSGTNKNVDPKQSQDKTNENIDSKEQNDSTDENTDLKTSTEETNGKEDSGSLTNKKTENEGN